MKLSDYVADFLVHRGVKHVFLLPGGACMHLCDSIGKRSELNYVCCLHEQACAFAAEAYGEYTNDLGVCVVTAGPGGTNALTGVACAWIESAPTLFISGQAKRTDLMGSRGVRSMGPQEVDIISMAKPVTKYAVRVMDPSLVRYELEKGVYLAQNGRKGPVWLDIPLDIQAAQIDPQKLISFSPEFLNYSSLTTRIGECIDTLRRAKRPVIYAGNGIRSAGVAMVFRELVERLKIPVLLSWKAADLLPDNCPYYIGRPGGIGQRAANFTQQKSDWMLVLGARLDLPTVAFNIDNFAPQAFKIVIDIDETELEKFDSNIQLPIHADLRDGVDALIRGFSNVKLTNYECWLETCRSWVQRFPIVLPEYRNVTGFVSTYALIDVLSDEANANDLIVPGSSGPCSDILMQAWKVKDGQRILNAPGLGAMGTGLPATLGACLASGKRVINVNGDGGFQLNIQELETVRRLNLPIKYFVLDNGGYRSIVSMQRNHFQHRLVGSEPSSGLTLPNIKRVAEAYGIKSFSVASQSLLRSTLRRVLRSKGPTLCVVKTSVDEATAPKCISELRTDGTVASKPMEDMWPFLEREEFNSIMKQ